MTSRALGGRSMVSRPVPMCSVGCLAMALALYAVSPLAALWSVATGLRHEDVGVVRNALDWRAVRTAFKVDFGGGLPVSLASATVVPAQEELPDFGESFATNIVSHVVDDVITPERLVAMLSHTHDDTNRSGKRAEVAGLSMFERLGHLTFLGPTRFEAAIRVSDDPAAEPVRVSMRLEKWQWKITEIHLPEQMLNPAGMNQGRSSRT